MITDRMIDQAYSDLKSLCGGVRNDYFGLLCLERDYNVLREHARNQVAFGGNDYGLDGFHFDVEKRNLYLFQFKNSKSSSQFRGTLQRLIEKGMDAIFGSPNKAAIDKNQILLQLDSCLRENREIIKQVYFRFIFTGDPTETDKSPVLEHLREDLENRKYLIDRYFGDREVGFTVEFRSVTGKVGVIDRNVSRAYRLPVTDLIERPGPNNESMHVGFVRLIDLHQMHTDMNARFFERNIRFGLGGNRSVNRSIEKAFQKIVMDGESSSIFSFNHNGITLAAEHLERVDGDFKISAPRLLNGAQTVTTFGQFIEKYKDHPAVKDNREALEEIRVLAKIVTRASSDFITRVTVNNNRQNPVEPWNLRANDMIQLQLQEKFKEDLGVFYERQENAFENLEDLGEEGITENKPVQIRPLTQVFLATDGEVDKMQRLVDVFEDDRLYSLAFNEARMKADTRQIMLCYKVHFRLRRLVNDIVDKGPNRYGYMNRSRSLLWALICQGVLNDPKLSEIADKHGTGLSIDTSFMEKLSYLATARCRMLIGWLIDQKEYAERVTNGKFDFLRTNTAFERCMERAYSQWRWTHKKLR